MFEESKDKFLGNVVQLVEIYSRLLEEIGTF